MAYRRMNDGSTELAQQSDAQIDEVEGHAIKAHALGEPDRARTDGTPAGAAEGDDDVEGHAARSGR